MNPVKTLWYSPRSTAQRLIHQDNEKQAMVAIVSAFCFLALFQYLFSFAKPTISLALAGLPLDADLPSPSIAIALSLLFMTAIVAWVFFRLFPVLLHRFGAWFGGRATEAELRIVVAWASLPLVAGIVLAMIPPLFGPWIGQATLAAGPIWLFAGQLFVILLALLVLFAGVAIYVHMVAVAERFSAWRAAGTLYFAGILPITAILAVGFWFGGLVGWMAA